MKLTRLMALPLVALLSVSHAKEEPVPTGFTIDSLKGSIELLNGQPPVTSLELTLMNETSEPLSGNVGFHSTDMQDVTLEAGASTVLTLIPAIRHAGMTDRLQKTEIDLTLIVNDEDAPAVGTTDVDILIPEAAYPLVRAEPPVMDNGRNHEAPYEYYAMGQQLQPLTLTYNPGPVNLTVRKTIYPIPVVAGPVEISVEVTNNGSQSATGLILRDALSSSDFSGEGEAFSRFAASEEDIELVWEATISELAPGQSQRLNYTVTARYDVGDKQLPATTVIMNDELTGMSNKVWLPKWH